MISWTLSPASKCTKWGEENALKNAIVGVLKARFKIVPNQVAKQIRAQPSKILKTLLEEASICQDIKDFKEKLLPIKKA